MLKLPLTFYDESGRILPPRWLYSVFILLCIDWLAFVFSLASRTQTSELLTFFYPQKETLGLGLAASLPVLIALSLVSQRDRLWKKRLFSMAPMGYSAGSIGGVGIVECSALLRYASSLGV